jgi:hypothetical protein
MLPFCRVLIIAGAAQNSGSSRSARVPAAGPRRRATTSVANRTMAVVRPNQKVLMRMKSVVRSRHARGTSRKGGGYSKTSISNGPSIRPLRIPIPVSSGAV